MVLFTPHFPSILFPRSHLFQKQFRDGAGGAGSDKWDSFSHSCVLWFLQPRLTGKCNAVLFYFICFNKLNSVFFIQKEITWCSQCGFRAKPYKYRVCNWKTQLFVYVWATKTIFAWSLKRKLNIVRLFYFWTTNSVLQIFTDFNLVNTNERNCLFCPSENF